MDGLHVRVAHGTWGIAEGLEVLPLDSGRVLVVSPGVGFDHCGTVMQLSHEGELAPPARARTGSSLTERGERSSRTRCAAARGARLATATSRVGGRDAAGPMSGPVPTWVRRESGFVRAGVETFTNPPFHAAWS